MTPVRRESRESQGSRVTPARGTGPAGPQGPAGAGFNPLQIATLRWWQANVALPDITVGANPMALAFDGANIWAANENGGSVSKVRASDGAALGTYVLTGAGTATGVAFDGANIWVVGNRDGGSLYKLRPSDGTVLDTYTGFGQAGGAVAFDGANIWVGNSQATAS